MNTKIIQILSEIKILNNSSSCLEAHLLKSSRMIFGASLDLNSQICSSINNLVQYHNRLKY